MMMRVPRLVSRSFATLSHHAPSTSPTPPTPGTIPGTLLSLPHRHETPHIGTRFPSSVQLSVLLSSPSSAPLLTSLASLVAQRGVVFFEGQDITLVQQKELALRMNELSGAPSTSTLHRHPISENSKELGDDTSVISSEGGIARGGVIEDTRASKGWHSDITFENAPAAFSILKMHTLPPIGGDTLWASCYEAYDRLSPSFAAFLEGLTALHSAPFFVDQARELGITIQDPRGSPDNTGSHLTAVHPVIRTHPVTNYKALFVNPCFTTRILELHPDESASVLSYLTRHISENHDLQVRYRWAKDDLAIWDNRATQHSATNDYGRQRREGYRVVSVGERPYLDRNSLSRRTALGLR